jgi:hypothetical protein
MLEVPKGNIHDSHLYTNPIQSQVDQARHTTALWVGLYETIMRQARSLQEQQ